MYNEISNTEAVLAVTGWSLVVISICFISNYLYERIIDAYGETVFSYEKGSREKMRQARRIGEVNNKENRDNHNKKHRIMDAWGRDYI